MYSDNREIYDSVICSIEEKCKNREKTLGCFVSDDIQSQKKTQKPFIDYKNKSKPQISGEGIVVKNKNNVASLNTDMPNSTMLRMITPISKND